MFNNKPRTYKTLDQSSQDNICFNIQINHHTRLEGNENFHQKKVYYFPLLKKKNQFIKNSFDTLITILLFIFVFSWLWPIIIIIIKRTSKGPVFFKQEREGRKGGKFICYKFRTMKIDDIHSRFMQAQKNDPRITFIGKILRHYSLDELPQFYNVLKGEMSIVGPRPHPVPLNEMYRNKIQYYDLRHKLKPGITGLAQIKGLRGPTDLESMRKRIFEDIEYVKKWSFSLDLKILLISIWKIIKGDAYAF